MTTQRSPTPQKAARGAQARLRALASPEVAAGGRKFFKQGDSVRLLGVRAPQVRALAGELYREVKSAWGVADAVEFCDAMSQARELEARVLGVLLLGRYRRAYERTLLRRVEQWIREGRFANWAEIDALAPGVVTPLIERFPDLVPRVMGWTSSRNQWMRRAAVVSLVLPARRGEKLDVAYRVVRGLLDDREDLMHKACGWLLREAGKTDMARLERFLLQYGSRMPRTSVRYAIERFPERKRKQLLVATRVSGGIA